MICFTLPAGFKLDTTHFGSMKPLLWHISVQHSALSPLFKTYLVHLNLMEVQKRYVHLASVHVELLSHPLRCSPFIGIIESEYLCLG